MGYPDSDNGYLQVYVANQSDTEVYFDDMEVAHTPTLIAQENHYYPFGMNMVGIEKAGVNHTPYQYNQGTERETSFGLHWDETPFRRYDAQLGRFHGVDALAESFMGITPYQYAFNNPTMYNDPSGLEANVPGPVESPILNINVDMRYFQTFDDSFMDGAGTAGNLGKVYNEDPMAGMNSMGRNDHALANQVKIQEIIIPDVVSTYGGVDGTDKNTVTRQSQLGVTILDEPTAVFNRTTRRYDVTFEIRIQYSRFIKPTNNPSLMQRMFLQNNPQVREAVEAHEQSHVDQYTEGVNEDLDITVNGTRYIGRLDEILLNIRRDNTTRKNREIIRHTFFRKLTWHDLPDQQTMTRIFNTHRRQLANDIQRALTAGHTQILNNVRLRNPGRLNRDVEEDANQRSIAKLRPLGLNIAIEYNTGVRPIIGTNGRPIQNN